MTISDNLISFDALPSLLAACVVLLLGTLLSQRIALLARYSIPSPVIGGVLFAIAAAVLVRTTGQGIAMANAAKSDLLLLFFACLGLTSNLRRLLRGGPRLLRFLAALVPFLMVQDGLGVLLAKLLGLHPFLGLVAGSITLVGGHGTGAAYVEKFGEASAIPGAMALTMTSATLGLVLGGVIGGRRGQRRDHGPSGDAGDHSAAGGLAGGGAGRGTDRPVARPVARRCAGHRTGFFAELAGGAGAAQRRRAGGTAAARRGVGPDRVGLLVAVFGLDDDGARPRHRLRPGRAAADHPGRAGGAGGALGVPGHLPRGRAGLRERGDGGRVLRLRDGRDGDGDRQHAGARAPPRSGAAGLSHHPDRRRLLHRHHQCGRADAVPVARHDGVRVTEGFQLVAGF